jgi:GAF domain
LDLLAGALYRRSDDGRRFEGVATSDDTLVAPMGFDRNHNLVRFLQASEDSVWLDEVRAHLDASNSAIYVLAVPVCVRHELVSFVLYGAHRNGSQIDPDEVALLKALVREAARAYDHVEAVRTRELIGQLTAVPAGSR